MTLTIDKAGRIVLPKRVRDRLHLHPGANLSLEEIPEGLIVRPVRRKPSLVEEDGILVHMGEPPANYDWNRVLEDERDERLREIAGL
jgi:AbrB family looped-hinge helix DNA binding protein